jgi:hypothetical protein
MPTRPTACFGLGDWQKPFRLLRRTVVGVLLAAAVAKGSHAAPPSLEPIPRIPPGTVVSDASAARFNRMVYAAVSRITSGDAKKVPAVIRARVPLFTLAFLATVANTAPAGVAPSYQLAEVGVGYAVPLNSRLTIVDTEAPPAAAGIDMLGRKVLSANGRNLGGLRRVGKTNTLQVIDVESLVRVGNRHAPLTMRHFIWADPASGRVASCVWLLQKRSAGQLAPLANPPRWLQEGTHDSRSIHVDATKFAFGMPTQEAFAIASLPPGIELTWTAALRQSACLPVYGDDELEQLTAAINEALDPLRAPAD